MDTTVLMAAVLEHVGLWPLLVAIPGHILIGYWRENPSDGRHQPQAWYPNLPVIDSWPELVALRNLNKLGIIETTTLAEGPGQLDAARARNAGERQVATQTGNEPFRLIDITSARKARVHPLPTVFPKTNGGFEITVYQPDTAPSETVEVREEVAAVDRGVRIVDSHPPRLRQWKSALLSLNATSPLLNLKPGPSCQPILLEEQGLAKLEDKLHQDHTIEVLSGFDLPEVYRAREQPNAASLPEDERMSFLAQRQVFVQRKAKSRGEATLVTLAKCLAELRAMARKAKDARDEKGMNPLFLAIGLLRWKDDNQAEHDAPLILVPVNLRVPLRSRTAQLTIDTTSQVAPNFALLEWLSREHGLTIPELQEPTADKAGIDVHATLAAVRVAVRRAGLPFSVRAEGRLALLDLAAFRMWQDLNLHGERFLSNPLVSHLVHTPLERFVDPAATGVEEPDLETLRLPVPADSTQMQAVAWAAQGRTFVLQGPPGTGKSQTITNMVAECVLSGLKVMFVAEKQTALEIVRRRLADVGFAPFMLNLHHEGSSAAQVRLHLKDSLSARATPDPVAMAAAQRRLRQAHFQLAKYPRDLHATNDAGLSAYSSRDALLALGDGDAIDVPPTTVARQADLLDRVGAALRDLQPWTAAAQARPEHPWRLVGAQPPDKPDLASVKAAIKSLADALPALDACPAAVRSLVEDARDSSALATLARCAMPDLPTGALFDAVLAADWRSQAEGSIEEVATAADQWRPQLGNFTPRIFARDLTRDREALLPLLSWGPGKAKRQAAFMETLKPYTTDGTLPDARAMGEVLDRLIAAGGADSWGLGRLRSIPGVNLPDGWSIFDPEALDTVRSQVGHLDSVTAPLRVSSPWHESLRTEVRSGRLAQCQRQLAAFASAWQDLLECLAVTESDLAVWRADATVVAAVGRHLPTWQDDAKHEDLRRLRHWIGLVNHVDVLDEVGLEDSRAGILDGSVAADQTEEAFQRGLARASLAERIQATGLDRFDSIAHDQRVASFITAQREVRRLWVTDAPARVLDRRESDGQPTTGGLARELAKTRKLLGTRALLRNYGRAVQELTPVVLTSPSAAVDLIEPGVMDFDVVIFDEASQITVPEAIGAMGRGSAVVVVGDSKQMPPSRRVGSTSDADVELDDEEDEVTEDQESILSECELARVPTVQLDWHYRSQDESLIAFSNDAYYEGALSSFPTPTLRSNDTGVEFRRVQGKYLRAGSETVEMAGGVKAGPNTNPEEAQAILAEVIALVEAHPEGRPSIGIVTFNEQQKQLIDTLIGLSEHPGVAFIRDESKMGRSDYLFVKALEQVQGDERDYVLFSIAFSEQQRSNGNSYIPLNFGRLNNLGGERRLNVAVTRARRKNVVFCSFDPAQLEAERSAFLGVKHLKEFLVYAKSGGQPAESTRESTRDRHRDEVAEALRAQGVVVATDVGLSDFRLDLLLSHADDPSTPLLPVLLDGPSWQRRRTVSDRDVLPVEVLTQVMKWPDVARVWWPQWLDDPETVLGSLQERLAELNTERVAQVAAEVAARGAALEAEPSASGETQAAKEAEPSASGETQAAKEAEPSASGEEEAALVAEAEAVLAAAAIDDHTPQSTSVDREAPSASLPPAGTTTAAAKRSVPAEAAPPEARPPTQTEHSGEFHPAPDGLAPYRQWHARTVLPADEVSIVDLANVLAEIVEAEGPMLAELAYRRYLRASGGQRLGGALKTVFNRAAARLVREGRVLQLVDDLPGQITKTLYAPESPPVVERERGGRELKEIPRSEVQVVLRLNGLKDELTEDVMRATLDTYGRSSLTKATRELLQGCASYRWSAT